MKKSQMEIMGLTIIVVILAFVMLFVVSFVMKPSEDTKTDKIQAKLASSVMSTLLKTTAVDCKKFTLGELVKDCREGMGSYISSWDEKDISDGTIDRDNKGNIECSPGKNSCSYALREINSILNSTLSERINVNYNFLILSQGNGCEATKNPTNVIFHTGPGCPATKQHECQPWPTSIETLQIGLDICSKI
ncbi:hypothetical protein HY638_00270 [Candidatus Woesearchaeota archaeon]|nr:hypothetical protein [Candidatus Woesearchaeota archaeon]